MKKIILIMALLLSFCAVQSQSLLGTTGWLNIPTAEMQEDGTFYLGGSYINRNYIATYGGGEYDALGYYFNLTFLPFLEVSFANTRLLNYTEGNNTVDRNFSVRLRVLRERKFVPAFVIGAHDLYSSISAELETNQYFSSLYLVASKHIPVKRSEIGLTLGYGFDVFRNSQFEGVFGGISFSPSFYRPLLLIAEYDGERLNLGGTVLLFRHLFLNAMVQDLKYFSGGMAYKVYLLNKYKKRKKKRKP
ncbi:MAG: YjbH domain-containing protein [bacterium]|jgi:hypothetical protein